jgi:tRNA (guanine37-N1)-methyltransferase
MTFHVLTLFPELIHQMVNHSIIGRAIQSGLITVNTVNIRDFAVNKHGQVDDAPYGGGVGMVLMAQPVYDAFMNLRQHNRSDSEACSNPRVVYLSPQGRPFTQALARELSQEPTIVLLCGHYEGLDERIIEEIVTDEISIGDYILTGGELASLVLIDAVSRLVPGVLGKEESYRDESFGEGLSGGLEYPHYTRPPVFLGREVPEVLLSGHHGKIDQWRREQSRKRTREKRPDLL